MRASLVYAQALYVDTAAIAESVNRSGLSDADIGEAVSGAVNRLKEQLKHEIEQGLSVEELEEQITVVIRFSHDT